MDVWNKTSTPTTFCITFTKYPHKLSYDPHNMTAHKTHPEFVRKGIVSVEKGTATPNRPVCYKTSVQRGGLRSITRNQVLSRWEERFIWYEHISPDSRCLHGSCCAVHKKTNTPLDLAPWCPLSPRYPTATMEWRANTPSSLHISHWNSTLWESDSVAAGTEKGSDYMSHSGKGLTRN